MNPARQPHRGPHRGLQRRAFLAAGGAVLAVTLLPRPLAALTPGSEAEAAVEKILAGRTPEAGGIAVEVPRVAENGAQVPITVSVDSPQTGEDHVTAIHLLAPQNPTPGAGRFRLTPMMARAEVSTRIRLAEEQEILVLAELSDGRVLSAAARIAVTVGGCAT